MEQLEQPVKPKKSIATIIGMVALAFLLLLAAVAAIFWQNIAEQAKSYAQTALTGQITNYLGREVSFGTIAFAPAGQVSLTDVAVYDSGAVLAKIPAVRVYYNWHWDDFNFRNFNFKDLAYIERIFLQKCEIFIRKENNHLDLKPILPTQQSGWDDFRGQVHFGAAKINLSPAWGDGVAFDEIDAEFDFKNPENISIDLSGSFDKMPLVVKGAYLPKSGELSLESGAPFDLALFKLERFSDKLDGVEFKEGVLGKFIINTKKTAADTWQFSAQGEFDGVKLNMPVSVESGRGSFIADNSKIVFDRLAFIFAGQNAEGKGNVLWQDGLENAGIDFTFSLPLVNPSSISPRLAGEEPLAVDVTVGGRFNEPAVSGKFSVSRLNLDNLPVSNITGNFAYDGNYRMLLQDIKGESLGGSITAFGDLYLDNNDCELEITGKKLDSFIVLGKDIRGELDFTGHLSSRSQTAIARGSFIVRNGSAYGTPFQVINGFFVKQNGNSDLSDIAVRTDRQRIYPSTLSKELLAELSSVGNSKSDGGSDSAGSGTADNSTGANNGSNNSNNSNGNSNSNNSNNNVSASSGTNTTTGTDSGTNNSNNSKSSAAAISSNIGSRTTSTNTTASTNTTTSTNTSTTSGSTTDSNTGNSAGSGTNTTTSNAAANSNTAGDSSVNNDNTDSTDAIAPFRQ